MKIDLGKFHSGFLLFGNSNRDVSETMFGIYSDDAFGTFLENLIKINFGIRLGKSF